MTTLKNTNRLYKNKSYQTYLKKISQCETDRLFCRHDVPHFLDVARIATIKCLETKLMVSRDLIYTAALLHDIGRFKQYQEKIPHEIASHELSHSLLEDLDFTAAEKSQILDAIINHRNPDTTGFNRIFYESDKLSRNCLACPVESECNWSSEKKNLEITY